MDYEVLIECIMMEVAWHSARFDEAGDDTEQGRLHSNAITALVKLRKSLNPRDESTVKRAWITLEAMEAERKQNDNQTQPSLKNIMTTKTLIQSGYCGK